MKHTTYLVLKVFLSVAVFALTVVTNLPAQATEKVIYTFSGGADGGEPESGLISDSKGNLYGTTGAGGGSSCSCGTVYELSPGSNGTWTEKVIYAFSGSSNDGIFPFGSLVFDGKGNLYGTTVLGGPTFGGTVFELIAGSNGTWTENILYNFAGADGSEPYAALIFDSSGNLYGTTLSGGTYGFGTVFELVSGSNGTWTEKVLHSFTGGNDGANPDGPLIFDGVGRLYGTTTSAGPHDYGAVFELTPGSKGWTEKIIYALPGAGGSGPFDGLIFDSASKLYGTSATTVFELTPGPNGTWTENTIHTFLGGRDGAYAESGLILDKAGRLFGTTYTGGAHYGTVYELRPGSDDTWTETVLHRFAASTGDGVFPGPANLVQDTRGNLYGTTSQGGTAGAGVVYEIAP
jgi:uncharacterized repeat protein (TIGR03803 family)